MHQGPRCTTELRVHNFSISLDGYAAGPRLDVDQPLRIGGRRLHEWVFSPTATETDGRFLAAGTDHIGATVTPRCPWPGEPPSTS